MRSTGPDPGPTAGVVRVAAGCLLNGRGEVLICQRPAHKIYPGEWEFPGGKLEPGESAAQALRRELHEELGVSVEASRPLIRLRHDYPELSVDLDVHEVTSFSGAIRAREHPATAWVPPDDLFRWKLLAADQPIVSALRLPPQYMFTPPDGPVGQLLDGLERLPAPALLRLRRPGASDAAYAELAARLLPACRARGISLLLDGAPARVEALGAGGWHATAAALRDCARRPVPAQLWFGASCHDADDLRRARELGADFAVLGPVLPTSSHPGRRGLGWDAFEALAREAGLPVVAIGGMSPALLEPARARGARGIAGISAYWSPSSRSGGVAPSSAGIA